MSQHIFYTTHENEETRVMMGWDRPLQGYFMVIEKEGDKESPFWSNLYHEPSHHKNLDKFLSVLTDFKINIPQQMINEILDDSTNDEENKAIKHEFQNGVYKRNICNDF